ncbi:Lateral signaling target protein 2-like [Hondaea fermentalgiana]|uniref:Lateral signaling target protein 2-like n=1 Tax=Hondaea fermentalgiana TaxID=2315210 RepID=A0A2R5G5T9_9STRA|nr:Lateral signaling target protein 2-like [Hondaea fermentalgiana]|eukprot:GBG26407.1 Lateral signaling target protein 2-like [Hondaea fermentalgiana]
MAAATMDQRRAQLASFFAHLDEELAGSSGLPETVVDLVVTGAHGGSWRVETKNGRGSARLLTQAEAAGAPKPACRVETDLRTLDKLANGEMRPAMALLRGKVSYSGSYGVLRELQGPFRRAAEKVMAELGPDSVPIATFVLDKNNPAWESDAERCKLCLARFTFWTRQHHCRRCGAAVCGNCSSHQIKGYRACSACWQQQLELQRQQRKDGQASQLATETPSQFRATTPASQRDDEVAANILPYQRLIEHIRGLQARSIAAAVETSSMAIRPLLLRIRKLEGAVELHAKASLPALATRLATFLLPKLLLTGALALAWAYPNNLFSLGFMAYCWNRPLLLGLSWLPFRPEPLQVLSTLFSTRPIAATIVLTGVTVLNCVRFFFGRLLRIYSTAFVVIFSYYTTYLVAVRAMGMGTTASTRIFQSLDLIMAPFACNEILALRSVFVKFGQYIGSRADIIPPRWATVLAKLQDDLPADRFKYVERCIEQEFGHKIEKLFESFEPEPMASASIAQVHRAVLRPNVIPTISTPLEVAVKVQHEGIEAIMLSDVVAFRRIIRLIAWLNPRFAIAKTLLRAWETEMVKELDFNVESSNLATVRRNLRQVGLIADADDDYLDAACRGSHVLVPRPVRGLVGRRAFCMTFIQGFKITDLEQLALFGVDRAALVRRVVQSYGCMIFVDGFTSADPHPGNLMVSVSDDGMARPVLLDFGMVVTLEDPTRVGYCRLVNSIANISVSGLAEAIASIGYKNSQSDVHPERDLEFFAHLLRDTGDRKSQRQSQAQFRKRRKAQRAADLERDPAKEGRYFSGFPDSLIFLFRVLGLIRGLCTTLDAPISYVDILGDYAKLGLMHYKMQEAADAATQRSSPQALPPAVQTPRSPQFLQGKVAQLLSRAQSDASHELALPESHGFAADTFLGAQVCVMMGEKVVVDTFAGVQDELSPVRVSSSTVFPLMDLTRVVLVVDILDLIDKGTLDPKDPICKHWSDFADKSVTIEDLLSYASNIRDIVPATTSVNSLRDYSSLKAKLQDTSAMRSRRDVDRSKAHYTIFTSGYIMAGLLEAVKENSIDAIYAQRVAQSSFEEVHLCASSMASSGRCAELSNGFAGFVRSMAMGGGTAAAASFSAERPERKAESGRKDLPSEASSLTRTQKTTWSAKNAASRPEEVNVERSSSQEGAFKGFTTRKTEIQMGKETDGEKNNAALNLPAASLDSGSEHDDDDAEQKEDVNVDAEIDADDEEDTESPLPPGVKLPNGALLDPCCVNASALRESSVPSFGAFGTARGLASVAASFFHKPASGKLVNRLSHGPLRTETSPLYGEMAWSLGLQVFIMPDTGIRMLVHHAFGGSMLVLVPELKVCVSVLVNCLTLDRTVTRDILVLVCKELNITVGGVDQLFGGMF